MTGSAKTGNCLHLVACSSADAVEGCWSQFVDGDAVLFLDDGVMHFTRGVGDCFDRGFQDCFFSVTDLQARGLFPAAREAGLSTFHDSEFAALLRKFTFCLTWK